LIIYIKCKRNLPRWSSPGSQSSWAGSMAWPCFCLTSSRRNL